ncbi:hypothetical protein [uncultured Amaricoccus sp.]|uniref:hypothetical protein n=1 Tax=uncultured Amaricoccus sp. TaxID=339341 RepID=UPI0026103FDC|nr:hypothetical protein [uncultured Amaricoccus sp.]
MVQTSRSGGYEGSLEILPLEGNGGTIAFGYQMYSIPDRMVLSTNLGVVYDSGWASGGFNGRLQIPDGATSLTIRLATADEGTAWDYSLETHEPDCPTLQADYAHARTAYVAARSDFRELAYVDLDLQRQLVDEARDLLATADKALIQQGIRTVADALFAALGPVPAIGSLGTIYGLVTAGIDQIKGAKPPSSFTGRFVYNRALAARQEFRQVGLISSRRSEAGPWACRSWIGAPCRQGSWRLRPVGAGGQVGRIVPAGL